ncbi:NAD(P)/FAD-dependent oxidoreductase [Deinococcus arenicola]|uniref:NAD(P)-binding protein n=1 Tax=Deinococcus arenicola TaxID=2994950 RepID=A0ABU4DM97_9DEIO|nr:NAD(P)-binding protein [Deinococcus sp. ZS9-10]MDV6373557.1 NAD(P)-binding protein [Deinococcus sp. ZS9-10]
MPSNMPSHPDVLIIGAGLAGLALAHELQGQGQSVRVLDKSRGVSGRAATRRTSSPEAQFSEARLDHGARYFTARHPRAVALAESGVAAGWNRVWAKGFASWQDGEITPAPQDGHPRYAPPLGMSALGRELARGLDVQTALEVTSLERLPGGWRVHSREGAAAQAARLVLNVPAPQALALLASADQVEGLGNALEAMNRVTYAPCWAAGVVLEQDIGADWPALALKNHPVLEWISREHTKRDAGHPPALMLQASAAWSRAHLERRPEEVLPELLAAAAAVLGEEPKVASAFAHRWRYATPVLRVPAPCLWDASLGLGLCGDGFTPDDHGPRVEAALLSGWALAARMNGDD